jgi:hypothetical protein
VTTTLRRFFGIKSSPGLGADRFGVHRVASGDEAQEPRGAKEQKQKTVQAAPHAYRDD